MNYLKEQLTNGVTLRVCRMENTHSITLILALKGGACWETIRQKGITHLIEHLCFRRCAGLSQQDFYYKIEHIGAHLRGITYRDRMLFEMTVNPTYFNQAVDILRSLFEQNGWTRDDIRREKEVVFRQLEDTSDYCLETMVSDFFNHSACGQPIAGTRGKLERMTKPQIEACKAELFCSENCEVTVTGQITSDQIRYAQDQFASIPGTAARGHFDIAPKHFLNRQNCHDQLFADEADVVKVGITFDVNTEKILPIEAEMLQGALFSGLLTPFTMRLREELGLLHEIQSNIEFFTFGGFLYFIFGVRRDQTLLLMDEMTRILTQQKECVDKKAFDCVFAAYTDGSAILLDDPRRFAYELVFDDGLSTPQDYIERNRQVSYKQICKAAEEIFRSQNMVISVNGMPRDQDFKNAIYGKKQLLRTALKE